MATVKDGRLLSNRVARYHELNKGLHSKAFIVMDAVVHEKNDKTDLS